jgi:nucleoid-associated protein YgaU
MYQFPNASEVMGYQEPEPLRKSTRYKIIIIANLLLALFVIAIVWFLFFFDAKPNNIVTLDQSLITKSVYREPQHSTGDFTPIITNDADPMTATPSVENSTISVIAKNNDTGKKELSAVDVIAKELEKKQLVKKPETIAVSDNKQTKPPTLPKAKALNVQTENELTLNKIDNSDSIKEASNETQKKDTTKSLSAIDLITNELMKNKNKKSPSKQADVAKKIETSPPLAAKSKQKKESSNEIIQTQQQEKQRHLEKNQIVIEQSTEQPLVKKLAQISQKLNNSTQQLVKKLTETDKAQQLALTDTAKSTGHKSRNTAIYNSIPLKKESDVDKIMLAMGSIKKTAEEKTVNKIDVAVKKLLKSEAGKLNKTDLYIKKLQPESEENRKEVRTITVKQGEKLWDIAVRAYGDGNKYKILLQANPVLKNNPKLIKAGITLRAPL